MKKSIYKRCFFFFKKFIRIKLLRSNRNHFLYKKNKFSKKYLRKRFFLNNFRFLKKQFNV